MIQDIFPHIYHNEFHLTTPTKQDLVLAYNGRQTLVMKTEAGISFAEFAALEQRFPEVYEKSQYLFAVDETRYFLADMQLDDEAEAKLSKLGLSCEDITIYTKGKSTVSGFVGITGWQLYNWYRTHQYCGCCGKPLIHSTKERMVYCEGCKTVVYPKISPAVIVAVTHGNRLLVSKYAGREYKNYALLAGFAEIGEPIEDTVRREVMEEVGLKVKNIRYYKSQPWSLSDSLLLGFFCELDGEEDITLDANELAEAEWIEREDLPPVGSDVSLTREMMEQFKAGNY